MRSTTLLAVILTAAATTSAQQATNEAQFTSAADDLISAYIPTQIASFLQSAASLTNLESALIAGVPTNVPSQYSANIASLESAISALRGAASTGIAGASRVVTTTDFAGSPSVTTVPPTPVPVVETFVSGFSTFVSTVTPSTTLGTTGTGSASTGSTTTTTASTLTTSVTTSTVSASSSSSSSSETVVSSTVTTTSVAAAPTANQGGSSSSSKGWAAPTQVPVIAAGAVGVLQILAAAL